MSTLKASPASSIEEEKPPLRPTIDLEDDEIENAEIDYSDRGPGDWVLSGPLGDSRSKGGRRFDSWKDAEKFVRGLHGRRVMRPIKEAEMGGRWAFLIRKVEVN